MLLLGGDVAAVVVVVAMDGECVCMWTCRLACLGMYYECCIS